MADLEVNYKGSKIAELNTSGTKTLKTSGKYCEGDITINYVKSTGSSSYIIVKTNAGALITCDSQTYQLSSSETEHTFEVDLGIHTITITKNSVTETQQVNVDIAGAYTVELKLTRLPNAYQEVEYITSGSGGYFQTNYALNLVGKEVELGGTISFPIINGRDSYLMLLTNTSGNACVMLAKNVSDNIYGYNSGSTSVFGSTATLNQKYKIRAIWNDITGIKSLYENDVLKQTQNFTYANDRKNAATFRMGLQAQTNWCSYYNEELYVKVDGTKVLDLVPCYRKSDNKVGLYNLLNNTFIECNGDWLVGGEL